VVPGTRSSRGHRSEKSSLKEWLLGAGILTLALVGQRTD